jgi:hypothetical protein
MTRESDDLELDGFGREKLRHLKKHQPNLHRYLKSQGKVLEYVLSVQEQAGLYLDKANEAGRPIQETLDVIRETWISLPDVDDPQDEGLLPPDGVAIQ